MAVTVAVAYLVVRLTYLVLARAARHESDAIRLAYERSRWSVLLTAFALVIGAFVGGVVQVVLLLIAVCYEFIRPRLTKNTAFPFSVSHFTERYGLVVMAAIGEGLLALGATANGFSPSAQLLVYCIVGFVIDCLLWSAYFRVLSPQLRRSLKDVDPATAGSQARTSSATPPVLRLRARVARIGANGPRYICRDDGAVRDTGGRRCRNRSRWVVGDQRWLRPASLAFTLAIPARTWVHWAHRCCLQRRRVSHRCGGSCSWF